MPPMSRALFALFFALLPALAWAEAQEPPDTKPARERHRIQEKEPPPPEGPWGPEDFGFTWHNPVWRGLIFNVGTYGAGSLSSSLPDGLQASSDGVNPPIFERLTWGHQSIRATSFSVAADLDMIRLSASFFHGDFDAVG